MASVVFGEMKKHDINLERARKSWDGTRNAFTAYLFLAQEKAKDAGLRLYFSNPFGGYSVPNLIIQGDKVTERSSSGGYSIPNDHVSELSFQEYIARYAVEGFNVRTAKNAVEQIKRILKEEKIKVTRAEVLKKIEELNHRSSQVNQQQ